MATPRDTSLLRSILVLAGLVLAAWTIGALIGYFDGATGDGGSTERGIHRGVRTGFLLLAMMLFVSVLGGFLFMKVRWPPMITWAILMGLGFAFMNGGGVLMGMNDQPFLWTTGKGFLSGAFIGAIAAPFIQRTQGRLKSAGGGDRDGSDPRGSDASETG